jgi:hypothetical protein
MPDPKIVLDELLKVTSGLSGRRLKNFGARARMSRIAEFIQDSSPLRALHAFQELKRGIERAASEHGWSERP